MTEPKRFMVADMAAFAVGPHSFEGEARERLKLSVLDSLGCAIGALGAEPVQAVRRVVEAFGGAGTCTVIGGPRSAPDRAAMMNGCLVRYLDFMDNYLRVGEVCHPADNFAAVLAASEDANASGQDFLCSLAVAYQVQARLLDLPTMRAGVNYTTPLAFSSAAGASRALGLDETRAANAMALAGVGAVSCAVIQAEPMSNWKGLSSGEAASRALHNTYLAKEGVTGDLGVFDGPFGLFHLVDETLDHDWRRESLDMALKTSIKKHNAEFQSQTAVDLALDLRPQVGDLGKVRRITLEAAQGAYDVIGGGSYGPKTDCHIKEQADHNLLYLVAVALLDGEVWPPQFTPERIDRPDVQALLRKVEVAPSEAFTKRIGDEMPVRLTIEREGGAPVEGTKTSYRGFHTDPMRWDEVRAKYDRLVDGKVDRTLGAEIADAVARLETLQVSDLTGLLGRVRQG